MAKNQDTQHLPGTPVRVPTPTRSLSSSGQQHLNSRNSHGDFFNRRIELALQMFTLLYRTQKYSSFALVVSLFWNQWILLFLSFCDQPHLRPSHQGWPKIIHSSFFGRNCFQLTKLFFSEKCGLTVEFQLFIWQKRKQKLPMENYNKEAVEGCSHPFIKTFHEEKQKFLIVFNCMFFL